MPKISIKDDGHNVKCITSEPDYAYSLFSVKDYYDVTLAIVKWTPRDNNDAVVYQPSIEAKVPLRVLYDGESISTFSKESIINPFPNKELFYESDKTYFFNHAFGFNEPNVANHTYNLTCNNSSLRFNNITLFHKDEPHGAVMDFRASYQEPGLVIILASRLAFEIPDDR